MIGFAAIYRNDDSVRQQAIQVMLSVLRQGKDLSVTPFDHPLVSTRPSWPDLQTLLNLPLNAQCEYFEYEPETFHSRRVLVIDVEVIAKEVDKLPNPS